MESEWINMNDWNTFKKFMKKHIIQIKMEFQKPERFRIVNIRPGKTDYQSQILYADLGVTSTHGSSATVEFFLLIYRDNSSIIENYADALKQYIEFNENLREKDKPTLEIFEWTDDLAREFSQEAGGYNMLMQKIDMEKFKKRKMQKKSFEWTDEKVMEFIGKYITCRGDVEDSLREFKKA